MKAALLTLSLMVIGSATMKAEVRYDYSAAESANPNFDFSGMERFWKTVAILEKDQEPSIALWDSLLNTPGYSTLIQHEFDREFFVDNFRLAFMPAKAKELEAALKTESDKPVNFQFLAHYQKAKLLKNELNEQANTLKKSAITDQAVEMTRSFLPQATPAELPPVAFVIFAYDARGYSPVVVDLLLSMDTNLNLVDFLAHEFHHYYRNKMLVFDWDKVADEDAGIMWTLNQIHCEGIADQIDKKSWFTGNADTMPYAKQYKELVASSPDIIKKMDKLLCRISDFPKKREELSRQLQQVMPQSGHPTGFFMANIIWEQLGKEALVKSRGNPFMFVRLYNESAQNKGGAAPCFSKKALRVVDRLEKKYAK